MSIEGLSLTEGIANAMRLLFSKSGRASEKRYKKFFECVISWVVPDVYVANVLHEDAPEPILVQCYSMSVVLETYRTAIIETENALSSLLQRRVRFSIYHERFTAQNDADE